MTNTTNRVVDADTHISESQHMWDLVDREMYHRRPVLVSVPDDTLYGERNAFWLIDGNISKTGGPRRMCDDLVTTFTQNGIVDEENSTQRHRGHPANKPRQPKLFRFSVPSISALPAKPIAS